MIKNYFAERKSDGKKHLPEQTALTGDLTLFAVWDDFIDEWNYVNPEDYELLEIEVDKKRRDYV